MYAYNRILVGLDLSDLDKTIIEYTSFLCDTFAVNKVYFMHIANSLYIPRELVAKYPNLIAPVDETIHNEIAHQLKELYSSNVEYLIEVKEGNPTEQILKWADFKDIDLVVMGRKSKLTGNGILPDRIVKSGHCSVLFVPESISKYSVDKLIVPVDFSEAGKIALEVVSRLQKKSGCHVVLQHSYSVPWGYHTTGKTFAEFGEIMLGHARNDMDAFIADFAFDMSKTSVVLMLDEKDDPAAQIHQLASTERADMIIIGSKGRSAIASALMGSVAEKVCKLGSEIPVLVVKNKNDNMGFLDALLNL